MKSIGKTSKVLITSIPVSICFGIPRAQLSRARACDADEKDEWQHGASQPGRQDGLDFSEAD
jgi:hypothetical protein